MKMYNISLLLLVLYIVLYIPINESITTITCELPSSQCTHKVKPKYFSSNSNSYELPPCCGDKVMPNDIKLIVGSSSGVFKARFAPPKMQCKYNVTLLHSSLVKDKEECATNVVNNRSNFMWEIHELKTVCHYMSDIYDESLILYEDEIELEYNNVFQGCYSLQFSNIDEYIRTGNMYIF